ncbi:hypothetical protein, partial [Borborobacter arsenicus]|uniref:hypothetical protein n=1 Tax=Borborobacter arsenicus TaxID=1851146 RepID=UPI003CCB3035
MMRVQWAGPLFYPPVGKIAVLDSGSEIVWHDESESADCFTGLLPKDGRSPNQRVVFDLSCMWGRQFIHHIEEPTGDDLRLGWLPRGGRLMSVQQYRRVNLYPGRPQCQDKCRSGRCHAVRTNLSAGTLVHRVGPLGAIVLSSVIDEKVRRLSYRRYQAEPSWRACADDHRRPELLTIHRPQYASTAPIASGIFRKARVLDRLFFHQNIGFCGCILKRLTSGFRLFIAAQHSHARHSRLAQVAGFTGWPTVKQKLRSLARCENLKLFGFQHNSNRRFKHPMIVEVFHDGYLPSWNLRTEAGDGCLFRLVSLFTKTKTLSQEFRGRRVSVASENVRLDWRTEELTPHCLKQNVTDSVDAPAGMAMDRCSGLGDGWRGSAWRHGR